MGDVSRKRASASIAMACAGSAMLFTVTVLPLALWYIGAGHGMLEFLPVWAIEVLWPGCWFGGSALIGAVAMNPSGRPIFGAAVGALLALVG